MTQITTKNSSTGAAVPSTGDLVQGELAVNVADKKLYTKDAGGAIVELGINPTTIDINAGTIDGTVIGGTTTAAISGTTGTFSGEITANGGIALGDSDKATFGVGDDLQIYHDGSNSYVADVGTGDLILRGSTGVKLQSGSGALEYLSTNSSTGSVELKLSGATKLATTSAGIDVTGTATMDGLISSGNVLVGKTSQDLATEGITINPLGYIQVTESASPALYLNRLSTDGSIVNLYKDGTAVGSIGNNTDFYIASADGTGIRFSNTQVLPTSESGATQNGSRDLGSSTGRFKDLYLSGGVYLGGTGAANKLDDYEEGTWTLTDQSGAGLSLTVYVAEYTKIGNKVFFEIGMQFPTTSSTVDLRLSLPFTAKATSDNTGGAALVGTDSGRTDLWLVLRNTAHISANTNLNTGVTNASYSGNQLKLQGAYTAA